jgi:ribulose-phosphate 3-epimerase
MSTIVPAILENSKELFDDKVYKLERLLGVEKIQIDFCDGLFVKNISLAVGEMDVLNPAFQWEAHLMVENPQNFIDYKIAGFTTLILHYEAFKNETDLESALENIVSIGMHPALAINPETSSSVLRYFADTIKHFTVLSVHPGKQGGKFINATIEKVKELREIAPHAIIEVDGGIKSQQIFSLNEAGADLLVVGSALFETENIQENFDALTQEVHS